MKSSARDKAESILHKVKGQAKETVGKIVGNPGLKTEGKIEKIQGTIQGKRGEIKKALDE